MLYKSSPLLMQSSLVRVHLILENDSYIHEVLYVWSQLRFFLDNSFPLNIRCEFRKFNKGFIRCLISEDVNILGQIIV